MGKSNHAPHPNGPKMYALKQIAHYLGPATAAEISEIHNTVLRNGFTARQVGNILGALPGVIIDTIRPHVHGWRKSVIQLYMLPEPDTPLESVHIRKQTGLPVRKVDRYIADALREADL